MIAPVGWDNVAQLHYTGNLIVSFRRHMIIIIITNGNCQQLNQNMEYM